MWGIVHNKCLIVKVLLEAGWRGCCRRPSAMSFFEIVPGSIKLQQKLGQKWPRSASFLDFLLHSTSFSTLG